MRRRKHYKFTEKTHSKRGMLSCILTMASVFALAYTVYESFLLRGAGTVYLGCLGVLAMLVSGVGFYQGIRSLMEEDSYKTIPVIAAVFSVLVTGTWIAVYVSGFLV